MTMSRTSLSIERQNAIGQAITTFFQHRQLNPPDGLCQCGYQGQIGEHFLAHVFDAILPNDQARPDHQPERNTAPEEQWSAVWKHIDEVTDYHTNLALRKLYWLLEPASVRERRTKP